MLIFSPSCRLFRTMKIEQLLQFSDNSSAVQSTVTNNKIIQQTVIHLFPMMHNPRITFCHTQIFRNIWQYNFMAQMIRIGTLIYIEKWCLIAVINLMKYIIDYLLTLIVIYFVVILMNKHKFFIYFQFISVMVKYVINKL